MTNKKITDLVELTTPTTDDVFPLVDIATNSTRKAQLANLPISTATQTALDAKQATLVSGTNIKTINSTSLLGSGNIDLVTNPAGTAGQIQFSDGSAFAADSNLFWDNTNKRLGIGTSTPGKPFEVLGDALINAEIGGDATLQIGNSGRRWDIKSVQSGAYYQLKYTSTGNIAQSIDYLGNTSIGAGAAATARLHVKGSGSTSATTSLLVQNSSGTDLLKVADNGQLNIGGTVSRVNSNSNDLLVTSGNMRFSGVANFGLGNYPNASAVLEADSTTKGFLPPRMTTTQKSAISAPASGLQVFDTDTAEQNIYDGSGWRNVIAGDNTNLYWDNTNKRLTVKQLTVDSDTQATTLNLRGDGLSINQIYQANNITYNSIDIINSAGIEFKNFTTVVANVRANNFGIGIGSTAPTARLQVKGSGSTSATTALLVQNSSGTELLSILDDGLTRIGKAGGNVFLGPGTSNYLQNGYNWLGNYNALGTWNMGGATTEATAIVNIQSTTKGFLPPRMTTTQKNAISTPAAGLMVYDTDTNKLCCYNGTSWNDLF